MGISNFLNSLFGKAKVAADEVIENVEEFTETAKVKASEASEWAEEKAHQAKEALEDVVDKVEDKIEEFTSVKKERNKVCVLNM